MGNPEAKAAAKAAKLRRKIEKGKRVSKRAGTRLKHIQGNASSNDATKDPRCK